MSNEHEAAAAARSFHEFGSAIEALGRRLRVGSKLIAIGRQLANLRPRDLSDMTTLRRPVDHLRALVDEIATLAGELRTLVDTLATTIGIDN